MIGCLIVDHSIARLQPEFGLGECVRSFITGLRFLVKLENRDAKQASRLVINRRDSNFVMILIFEIMKKYYISVEKIDFEI